MPEITFREFTGINKVQDAQTLKPGELTAAMNLEIDDQKRIKSRDGTVLRIAGDCHSAFGVDTYMLYRTGSLLNRVDPDFSVRTLLSGLSDRRIAYTKIGNNVFFSDGVKTYRTDGVTVVEAGIEAPVGQPDASSMNSGGLPLAKYQYALTYVSADGRESPTGVAGILSAVGGISFSNIPVSSDSQVTEKRLYVTEPNGEDLMLALILYPGDTTARHIGGELGMECNTQLHLPTPAGSVLSSHNGSLLIGHDKFVWFTPPYRNYVVKHTAFLAMPNNVTVIASMSDGFWVCTTNEIGWVGGTEGGFTQKVTYGAIKGAIAYIDNDGGGRSALVATTRGVCQLADGGSFKNLTSKTYHPSGRSGAAIFRRGDFNQFLAVLR